MLVVELALKLANGMSVPPKLTTVSALFVNPVPAIVTVVPPIVVPVAGAIPVIVGAESEYVNDTDGPVPLLLVAFTLNVPAV